MNVSKAGISSIPQQPELANHTILESCHKNKYIGEQRTKKNMEVHRRDKKIIFENLIFLNHFTHK